MKLSIILPSLRKKNALKCVECIRASSFTNPEIILIGGKNSELHYLETIDNINIYVEDDKCIGTTYAIQKGLEQATGDYIVTLSDDALVCPHWDDYMINLLEKQLQDKILLGNFKVYNQNGFMSTIGYYGIPFSMFPIIRRTDIEKVGGYFSTEYNAYYADPDLGLRIANTPNSKFITCPSALIYHVYNPDQLHLNNKSKYWEKDEATFKQKWNLLGTFNGCEKINE